MCNISRFIFGNSSYKGVIAEISSLKSPTMIMLDQVFEHLSINESILSRDDTLALVGLYRHKIRNVLVPVLISAHTTSRSIKQDH